MSIEHCVLSIEPEFAIGQIDLPQFVIAGLAVGGVL